MYLVISLIVTVIELLKYLYLDQEYLDEFEVWVNDISTSILIGFSWKLSIPLLITRNIILAFVNRDDEE
mgnify:FL=1